jgi:pyruvate,water dikinase
MTDLVRFEQIQKTDTDAVGGKALSLARMTAANLPVPPGFCLTTAIHRRLGKKGLRAEGELLAKLREEYEKLGGGAVAVRSSATAEDGAAASFAGQQETFLGVQGMDSLCSAIERCWASLEGKRAKAYRQRQGVAGDNLAMAVVVQRLVSAQSAGVMFTRDPFDPSGQSLLIEAAWGLGEAVVSGRVSPDRFHLDRETGRVLEWQAAIKTIKITAGGEERVPVDHQSKLCLDETQLAALWQLGRQVEALYGEPRDVEWAFAEGKLWLLQARPITAADAAERETVRQEEIGLLRARAEPGGTVWSRFNLAEILPEPTPMSWSVVRLLMSGKGGNGLMHRDLGFRPDLSVDDEGAYDLVAGRPYCNLSREPRFYPGWLAHEHSFSKLKADPTRALNPRAEPKKLAEAGPAFWLLLPLRLPFIAVGSLRFAARLGALSRDFAGRFRLDIIPAFIAATDNARQEDWSNLAPRQLLERFDLWLQKTVVDFARESLKPTALAAVAMGNLERWLVRKLGSERARTALNELSMGVRPDAEADLPHALAAVAKGEMSRDDFLKQFGHRGSKEMELAQPRWAEDPHFLDRLPKSGLTSLQVSDSAALWEKLAAEAKFGKLERAALEPQFKALQDYLALRETAKHHLMRGYFLLRRALLALDRHFRLQGGIFYLSREELPRLVMGEDFMSLISQRKRRRLAALSLEVPPVLFSDDLEGIGRPIYIKAAEEYRGIPLSSGTAEGSAFVLMEPTDHLPDEPFILVCPSTDPAWVPLFAHAKGLVMETGGILSHGAIVAREFGLPAAAGFPGIMAQLRTGDRIRVNGATGIVQVISSGTN